MDDGIFDLMNRKTTKIDAEIPKSMGRIIDDGWEKASLVNPAGSQYKLGRNAVWVWKSCHGHKTRERLTKDYATEFNIGVTQAKSTSEEILANLERMGLVRLSQ
jgi:hypothetical protein